MDILKGNFKPKKDVSLEEIQKEKAATKSETLQETWKKAALNSIGGSMVYVEETELVWDGNDPKSNA